MTTKRRANGVEGADGIDETDRADQGDRMDDIIAAARYRDALVPRADGHHGLYPWWYGWAVMAAYLAGVTAERNRRRGKTDEVAEMSEDTT